VKQAIEKANPGCQAFDVGLARLRRCALIHGLIIGLDALGATDLQRAAEIGMSPDLLHRVAFIGSGTLDSLPHKGAVVTLLSVCGSNHREAHKDMFMVGIVGAIVALVAVKVLRAAAIRPRFRAPLTRSRKASAGRSASAACLPEGRP
jgi:hypothetical protein